MNQRLKQFAFLLRATKHDILMMRLMPLVSLVLFSMHAVTRNDKSIGYLLASWRAYPYKFVEHFIKRRISEIGKYSLRQWRGNSPSLDRFIILKFPVCGSEGVKKVVEKGVVLIKFSEQILPFYAKANLPLLFEYFHVVLEPSWAGYAEPSILAWVNEINNKVLVCCPEETDYHFIRNLGSNLVPTRIGASDWADDKVFKPSGDTHKKYDAVYVANYNIAKRLHRFFRALGKISDPDYKAAIICSSGVGEREPVLSLADFYGVRNKFDLYEDLTQLEINDVLRQSKVNILLSLKEGANKTIFEGMFADVPCIVLKENIGANKEHINPETGRLVADELLESELLWFRENWKNFEPRKWALKNISPAVSAARLGDQIKSMAGQSGGCQAWTQSLYTKVNSPELAYCGLANWKSIQKEMNSEFVDIFISEKNPSPSAGEVLNSVVSFSGKWQQRVSVKVAG